MDQNKQIIDNCPNFYKIVNFDYFEGDNLTACLIKIYRSFIFSINPLDNKSLEDAKKIDSILARYIDDYIFRKTMKYELTHVSIKEQDKENLLQHLINSIIGIFEQYEEGRTRNIYIARWI